MIYQKCNIVGLDVLDSKCQIMEIKDYHHVRDDFELVRLVCAVVSCHRTDYFEESRANIDEEFDFPTEILVEYFVSDGQIYYRDGFFDLTPFLGGKVKFAYQGKNRKQISISLRDRDALTEYYLRRGEYND